MLTELLKVALLLCILSTSSLAHGCYCLDSFSAKGRISHEMRQYDSTIFSGKLIEWRVDSLMTSSDNEHYKVFTFQVFESWQGMKKTCSLVSVFTCNDSCASYFDVDSTYIIYGKTKLHNRTLPAVYTDGCTRTKLLSKAEEDLKILGSGTKHPIPNAPMKNDAGVVKKESSFSHWLIASLILNFILCLVLFVRR